MPKKKFLLAGGLGSIHIYNLVKNVLSKTDYEIVAYNTTGSMDSIPNNYLELYKSLNIKIIPGRSVAEVGIIKYIKGLYSDFKKFPEFDIANLHYVSHYVAPVVYLFRKKFKKLILTFWGSDLLRSTALKRLATLPVISKSQQIQVMTDGMKEDFIMIPYYRKYVDKIKVLDFGDLFLDGIDNSRELNISEVIKSFGLTPNLPVVTIGYVGRPEMQQIRAVKAILSDSHLNRDAFQLALPVYGMYESLKESLVELLKNSGITYKIFSDFMPEETVVKFRVITDIFIHPQTTDALSCSVVECFYSGSVIINGEWLKYDVIDSKGAYYHKFNNFEDLSSVLNNVLRDLHKEKSNSLINIPIIKSMMHWDVLRPEWLKMYKCNDGNA